MSPAELAVSNMFDKPTAVLGELVGGESGPKGRASRHTFSPFAIEWDTRRRRLLVYGSAGHGCFAGPVCDEPAGCVIVWEGKSASLMTSSYQSR